jgi:hypothetical protein
MGAVKIGCRENGGIQTGLVRKTGDQTVRNGTQLQWRTTDLPEQVRSAPLVYLGPPT